MALSVEQLTGIVNQAFQAMKPMHTYYQTLAENFYPERADFTTNISIDEEFANDLADSAPIQMRRDLGDSLSAMMRDGEWFKLGVGNEAGHEADQWLEWAQGRLYTLINDSKSNFTGATKEADHDFVTFGSPVISVERNRKADGILFRCWHLRDCSWWDDENGQVAGVVRNWKPTYRQMVDYFGDEVHADIKEKVKEKPFTKCRVVHAVVPSEMCREPEKYDNFPFVSFFIDMENKKIMEEIGVNHNMYVIPRFKRFPGTAFAYSPATSTALPDARTGQSMQFTLLEVAERMARPPLIGTEKAVRGDIDLSSDGVTWVDSEYDERLGEALRPLNVSGNGYPIGIDAQERTKASLQSSFYANRLSLPGVDHTMTATEVIERMKQYRRENLPLFQPIEEQYNGQLMDKAFDIAFTNGYLGSPQDIPESLMGSDIVFKFISPLSEAADEKAVAQLQAVSALVMDTKQHDPTVGANVNWDAAMRDAAKGSGAPDKWLRTEEEVQQSKQAAMVAQAAQAMPELMAGENE